MPKPWSERDRLVKVLHEGIRGGQTLTASKSHLAKIPLDSCSDLPLLNQAPPTLYLQSEEQRNGTAHL